MEKYIVTVDFVVEAESHQAAVVRTCMTISSFLLYLTRDELNGVSGMLADTVKCVEQKIDENNRVIK